MITVGCAGFAVPATRYFKEYLFVEIQETFLAPPGQGTVRRWRREAPDEFAFALLAPKEIGQEGFREGRVVDAALATLEETRAELRADTIVFTAPADFAPSRPNRAALKAFLERMRGSWGRVVFDLGSAWKPDECDEIAENTRCLAARDVLAHGLSKRSEAYYRLPGPAGHKSRYEDPAIERLAELLAEGSAQEAIYVFCNVDQFTDAKRLRKAAGLWPHPYSIFPSA